MPWFMEK